MKFLRLLITLIIVVGTAGLGAMFAIQNDTQVPLDMLIYTFAPKTLGLWVLGAFALGGVLGMVASSVILMRMRVALGSSKRQLEKTRSEVSKLQDTPAAIEAA
ncbi:MAG: lipopolysaccharide assembly LapA domain-containing protein [Halioglobus sp.]